ncbi:hypothetical protein OIO90_005268 [Microbotryomycetes sp. JL221]|nr:hypothetical protein OIO90_005268 [Microbotryomycetes sp. JL221]
MVESSSTNNSCANNTSARQTTVPTAQADASAADEPGIGGPTYQATDDHYSTQYTPGSDKTAVTSAQSESRDKARGDATTAANLESAGPHCAVNERDTTHNPKQLDHFQVKLVANHNGDSVPHRANSLPNLSKSKPFERDSGASDEKATGLESQVTSFDTLQAAKVKRIQSWRLAHPVARVVAAGQTTVIEGAQPQDAIAVTISPAAGPQTPGVGADGQQRPPLTKRLLEPTVPVGKPPGWRACIKATIKYSWLNVLLLMVPVAWAMEYSHQSSTAIFITSGLAIIPCAALLSFATEELANRVGDAFGGLLNATFGNAVELIISILALIKGELKIVQSAILGSIISNILLVLGCCYVAGGVRFHEQGYMVRAAQTNINMLGLSVAAIVIPVAYHEFVDDSGVQGIQTTDSDVLNLSRGIAILLLITYVFYLMFQLWTHAYLYVPVNTVGEDGRTRAIVLPATDGPQPPTEGKVFRLPSWGSSSSGSSSSSSSSSSRAPSIREASIYETTPQQAGTTDDLEKGSSSGVQKTHENVPQLSIWFSLALLVIVTVITGVTAEALVASIDGLASGGGISKEFIGLVLLPILGNACEHASSVIVATKNKLDLSMSIAIGSSIQVSLFVLPLLILISWAIGKELTLYFDPFPTVVLFLAVCAVNWATADGRSNWLEGATLIMMYVIIAVVFWYYPGHGA